MAIKGSYSNVEDQSGSGLQNVSRRLRYTLSYRSLIINAFDYRALYFNFTNIYSWILTETTNHHIYLLGTKNTTFISHSFLLIHLIHIYALWAFLFSVGRLRPFTNYFMVYRRRRSSIHKNHNVLVNLIMQICIVFEFLLLHFSSF